MSDLHRGCKDRRQGGIGVPDEGNTPDGKPHAKQRECAAG